MQAVGEARVVLTGTGEEPQRVVLAPKGNTWGGEARAHGAPGYVAVAALDIDGHTESARLAWGEVPEAHSHGGEAHSHEGGKPHSHGGKSHRH